MSGVVTTDGTYTVTLSGALPEVDYGQYYLLGVTDSTGMLFEADETNKVLPVPTALVPGTPDLAPTQFSCNPIEVAAHENFTASWQVTNRGTGRTNGSWTDAVYLTTNGVLDGNAILLANITEQYTVGDEELCAHRHAATPAEYRARQLSVAAGGGCGQPVAGAEYRR